MVVKTQVKEGAISSIGLGQINRQPFDVIQSETVFEPRTYITQDGLDPVGLLCQRFSGS